MEGVGSHATHMHIGASQCQRSGKVFILFKFGEDCDIVPVVGDRQGVKKSVKSNLAIQLQLWDINRNFYKISFFTL